MSARKGQRKMLYMMHVDWRWIKQRPHFLAQELAKEFRLVIQYRPNGNRHLLVQNDAPIPKIPFIPIPKRRSRLLNIIDVAINRFLVLCLVVIYRPAIVWVTFPTLFDYIPKFLQLPMVYDCMDDVLGFDTQHSYRQYLRRLEYELVSNSAVVFCSSQKLKDIIAERYGSSEKYKVVRNALDRTLVKPNKECPFAINDTECVHIAYIGTIARWVDLGILEECVMHRKNVKFHLIGPVEPGLDIRGNDNIVFHGPVNHSDLAALSQRFDAFIMPFIINPLIEAVDPVKLYEYLAFMKPVVSVYYKEIERFSPYVSFYGDVAGLCGIIDGIRNIPIARTEVYKFISENTWTDRALQITCALSDMSADAH